MHTSFAELNNLSVDIDVAPPTEYVDAGPVLLPEGTYDLVIKDFEVGINRDGKFLNMIKLRRLQVVGPEEFAGRYANDIRVFTTPYLRKGQKVSGLGDLIRGIDDTAVWSGLEGATDVLRRAVDQGIPFRAKLQWEAYDKAGFEQEGGLQMERKSDAEKALRKRATVKGMRNFPTYPDGTPKSTVPGPISGEPLEASLTIDRVIPKSRT